jgi:hypothetical protein
MRLYMDNYNNTFLRYLMFCLTKKPHLDFSHQGYWVEFRKNGFAPLLRAFEKDMTSGADPGAELDAFTILFNQSFPEKYPAGRPFKYYGGHQFKLGHYYRHLFQTVRYIDQQEVFCYREKYEYAKTLRAQLSTPEQYLLFFNSLSISGRQWEFAHIKGKSQNLNCYLITKYNLIKNVPDLFFQDLIQIQAFYPDLNFEFREKSEHRESVEEKFR